MTDVTTHAVIVIVKVVDLGVASAYADSEVVKVTVNGLPVLSVGEVLNKVS